MAAGKSPNLPMAKAGGEAADDEFLGPLLTEKLLYYPTVTREPFRNRGRITDLITSEQLFNDIGLPPLHTSTPTGS